MMLYIRCLYFTEMMQVFAMFDQDRDGYIQASELGNILRLLGIPFSPDSLASMIANADTKGKPVFHLRSYMQNKRFLFFLTLTKDCSICKKGR